MHHHISTTDPEMEHYHCSLKVLTKSAKKTRPKIVLLYPPTIFSLEILIFRFTCLLHGCQAFFRNKE